MRIFRVLANAAFACSVVLAVATTVLSYLAAGYVRYPACAEKGNSLGYSIGWDGFIVIPMMAWFSVFLARRMGGHPKVRETLEAGLVVLELGTFQLTDSMLFIYGGLFSLVGFTGLVTFGAFKRYESISDLCRMILSYG